MKCRSELMCVLDREMRVCVCVCILGGERDVCVCVERIEKNK